MRARLFVTATGFAAPGLETAEALGAHLAGAPFSAPSDWKALPGSLGRRQALRLSDATRLAIMAAEQIGGAVPPDGGWVFGSSTAEGGTLHEILMALRAPEIMIQPIRFQNAVHNAAQGQWSIIAGATGPMTSIAAYDQTVGAGLLKAMMQAVSEGAPVGLVMFDAPMPPPLHEKRPFALPLAAAIALGPEPLPGCIASLEIEIVREAGATPPSASGVARELSDSANPIAFVLPLMQQILAPDGTAVVLDLPGSSALRIMARRDADG